MARKRPFRGYTPDSWMLESPRAPVVLSFASSSVTLYPKRAAWLKQVVTCEDETFNNAAADIQDEHRVAVAAHRQSATAIARGSVVR